MLKATFKSLLARKARLLMSAMAIVLGTAFVAGSLIFTDTLSRTFDGIMDGTVGDVVAYIQKLVFKILSMILWLAPIGAFGAIANVVGQTGWAAVGQLMILMIAFYVTCVVFVFGVLGLPVGFVGAAESKQALAARHDVPWMIVEGRLGGSAMAVAAVNALASEAE